MIDPVGDERKQEYRLYYARSRNMDSDVNDLLDEYVMKTFLLCELRQMAIYI